MTRTVRLAVPARSAEEATEMALAEAWEWLPDRAVGGDQGSAAVRVARAGDLPGDGGEDGDGCQPLGADNG